MIVKLHSIQSSWHASRRNAIWIILMCLILFQMMPAWAKVEVVEFTSDAQRALYKEMIAELRCLVCQNQNLADSNAELAKDLRNRTRELILQGKNQREIGEYMAARYGEFVLYRPRLTAATYFLWFAPGLLLLVILAWLFLRRRFEPANLNTLGTYSSHDLQRAGALLENELQRSDSEIKHN